ncbi:MAG: type VI secretion system baseplate subunit TssG [Defluviicoccus sp.]|nr:type VI secretion system baseplate subunit TssG [Defluviicoccus sp.]MDG4608538.1 type VI secretion system baseplate subunit TssG [Defluviicoccus sp.]MDS4071547.1 type VI secretion system baseplate subunit TssG [Defluviicoccus sp.]
MASPDRSAAPALSLFDRLEEAPHSFDFFQALRRLECAYPDRKRIGCAARPADEPVRLGQDPALTFAPSTLSSFTRSAKAGTPRLGGYFFGLFGPNGPLPLHLTDYAQERLSRRDATFARFLDVFHHRMLVLFYRAWAQSRPQVSYDRPDEDWFSRYLASLFGHGMASLGNRDALPDQARLYYAGLFAGQSRHPAGLQAMIRDYFGVAAKIEEFIGGWLALPPESRCRLGETADTGSLGVSAIAGASVWSGQHRFRIVLGALSLADYERFLPGQASLARLSAMVRSYVGDALSWEVMLVLKREEVPPLALDGRARLGLAAWLPAKRLDRDPCDLVFEPMAMAK